VQHHERAERDPQSDERAVAPVEAVPQEFDGHRARHRVTEYGQDGDDGPGVVAEAEYDTEHTAELTEFGGRGDPAPHLRRRVERADPAEAETGGETDRERHRDEDDEHQHG